MYQGLWRSIVGVAGLIVSALVSGCAPPPACSSTAPELTDIDFTRVNTAVDLADDVTQLNMGLKTEADLRQRWERPGISLEFRNVSGNPYTYMLFTDDWQQVQAIVLPGTTRPQEWRADFMIGLVYDEVLGINLHEGWRLAAQAVGRDVFPQLKPDYSLYIYGYSLGAGTGAILGLYMDRVLGVQVREIIASGMPRVTDAAGAATFNAMPLLRLAAGNDTIPFFPPAPYVTCGDVLVLLDGQFCSRQLPGDPDYDNEPTTVDQIAQLNPEDHVTYVQRMADKVGVPVCFIPYENRQSYIGQEADAGLSYVHRGSAPAGAVGLRWRCNDDMRPERSDGDRPCGRTQCGSSRPGSAAGGSWAI